MKKYKNLFLLFITYFFACVGWQFINTLIISFGKECINVNTALISSVNGTVALAGIMSRPFSGIIGKKLNAKKIYVFSLLAIAAAETGFALCSNYKQLYFFQIIRGVFWTFLNLSGQIIVANLYKKENLGSAISVFMLGSTIANIFSGIAGISLSNKIGYRGAFISVAALCMVAVVLSLFIDYEHKNSDVFSKYKINFNDIFNVKVIHIMVVSFVFQIMIIAFGGGFVMAFSREELMIANAGIYMTIIGIVGVITKPIYGKLYDRNGIKFIILICLFGYLSTAVILSAANSIKYIIVAALVVGLTTTGQTAALQAETIKTAGKENASSATNTRALGNDLGYMLGSVIFGFTAQKTGTYKNSYMLMAVILLISIITVTIYFFKKHRNTF